MNGGEGRRERGATGWRIHCALPWEGQRSSLLCPGVVLIVTFCLCVLGSGHWRTRKMSVQKRIRASCELNQPLCGSRESVDGTRGAGRAETGESRGRGGFVFRGTLYMELKPHAIARDLYQCEFFALSPPHGCRTLWSHTGPLRVRALARLLDIAAVWVCGVTARARGRAAG